MSGENFLESQGIVLKRGDGATPTEAFAAVPKLRSLSGPDGSATEIDITTLDSTAREYALGLKDSGTITIEGNYVPTDTQQAGLRADWGARTLRNFELHFTDSPATVWAFSAFVTSFSTDAAVDEVLTFSATLRISGDVDES